MGPGRQGSSGIYNWSKDKNDLSIGLFQVQITFPAAQRSAVPNDELMSPGTNSEPAPQGRTRQRGASRAPAALGPPEFRPFPAGTSEISTWRPVRPKFAPIGQSVPPPHPTLSSARKAERLTPFSSRDGFGVASCCCGCSWHCDRGQHTHLHPPPKPVPVFDGGAARCIALETQTGRKRKKGQRGGLVTRRFSEQTITSVRATSQARGSTSLDRIMSVL